MSDGQTYFNIGASLKNPDPKSYYRPVVGSIIECLLVVERRTVVFIIDKKVFAERKVEIKEEEVELMRGWAGFGFLKGDKVTIFNN